MSKFDLATMVCRAHGVEACVMCMVDDFHDWLDERKEERAQQLRAERLATPIEERFDLGGEA
jgi:hypothetical protein